MQSKLAIIMSGMVFGAATPATAQNCPALDGGRKIESDRYVVSYRTQPVKIAVGQHFVVQMAVCPKSGQPAPESVRVDGFMPDHNHGMNYKAVVKPAGASRYDAAGMMFHMPGKWDFIFEVRGSGKTDRMVSTIMLQ